MAVAFHGEESRHSAWKSHRILAPQNTRLFHVWQLVEVVPRRADCRSTRKRPRLQNASLARGWLSPRSHASPLGIPFVWRISDYGWRAWWLPSNAFSKSFPVQETNIPSVVFLYSGLEELPAIPNAWTCLDCPSMLIGVTYLGKMLYNRCAGSRTLLLSVAAVTGC